MKIKALFVLQNIADEFIAVPIGEEANRIKGIIKLNETSAFLWDILSGKDSTKEELKERLVSEYLVDEKQAEYDIDVFLEKIDKLGCLEK